LVIYSLMEADPLDAVTNAIRVAMTRALDWDANMPSLAAQAADAVTWVETWLRISLESEVSR
jgi:hypothetical protein